MLYIQIYFLLSAIYSLYKIFDSKFLDWFQLKYDANYKLQNSNPSLLFISVITILTLFGLPIFIISLFIKDKKW